MVIEGVEVVKSDRLIPEGGIANFPHMMPRCRSLYTRALAREDATMGTISWIIEHKHVAVHVYIYAAIRHALSGNACNFSAAGFM